MAIRVFFSNHQLHTRLAISFERHVTKLECNTNKHLQCLHKDSRVLIHSRLNSLINWCERFPWEFLHFCFSLLFSSFWVLVGNIFINPPPIIFSKIRRLLLVYSLSMKWVYDIMFFSWDLSSHALHLNQPLYSYNMCMELNIFSSLPIHSCNC